MKLLSLLLLIPQLALAGPTDPIKVMIIDTGLDIKHEAFDGTKIFCRKQENCEDYNGHGTNIASVVIGGNWKKPNKPESRVCSYLELYPCRYEMRKGDAVSINSSIKCIKEAMDLKIDIILYASAGFVFYQNEYNAIKEAYKKKIIFVTAAGNASEDLTLIPTFPAMYRFTYRTKKYKHIEPLGNIAVVGALTSDHRRLIDSNYMTGGLNWELGSNVFGATIDDTETNPKKISHKNWAHYTGTSQASAMYVHKKLLMLCGK